MPEATWPCSDLDALRPSLHRRDLCPGEPQVRLHETAKYLYARIPSSTYTGKATRTFVPLQHRNVKFDYVLLPCSESSSTRRPYCTKYIYRRLRNCQERQAPRHPDPSDMSSSTNVARTRPAGPKTPSTTTTLEELGTVKFEYRRMNKLLPLPLPSTTTSHDDRERLHRLTPNTYGV